MLASFKQVDPQNTRLQQSISTLLTQAERLIEDRSFNALGIVNRIMGIALQSSNPLHFAEARYILASYHCLVDSNYEKSIELCQQALKENKEEDIEPVVYKIYMTIGNAYQLKGDVYSAQIFYIKGLKMLEAKKAPTAIEKGFLATFYYNLSIIFSANHLDIPSEEYLEKAISIYEEIDHRYKLSKSYMAYAAVAERKKDYQKGIEYVHKSLEIEKALNVPYSISLAKANLGLLYLRIQNIAPGNRYINEALAYFEANKMLYEAAMVKLNFGEALCAIGRTGQGMDELLGAEKIFEQLENKQELKSLFELLSKLFAEKGDYKTALEYNQKHIEKLKQVFDSSKAVALARAKNEFETAQKEKEAALLREKNEEINHYVTRLERSNAELKQFAHVASHDLREPLRMIASYISLLKKSLGSDLTEQQGEFFQFVTDAARRMDHLIIDLLQLAKVDANPRKEDVRLNGVLDEIKLNLEMLLRDKKAHIISSGLPEIVADRTMMLQLFQNLISNGIKYNESAQPLITIKHRVINADLEITVSDNGIGIPEAQRERAFQIFQRVHSANHYEGSGIGLAICKKIVETLNGRISIEENPGGGTIFRMVFPAGIMVVKNYSVFAQAPLAN